MHDRSALFIHGFSLVFQSENLRSSSCVMFIIFQRKDCPLVYVPPVLNTIRLQVMK